MIFFWPEMLWLLLLVPALLGVYVPMLSNAGDYALALRLVESLAQSGQRH